MTNLADYRPLEYLPKFDASTVEGDRTVVTIESAYERNGQYGKFLYLTFEEFPGVAYMTNKTQAWALMLASNAKKLPPTVEAWVGWRVPLVKQDNKNPETGSMVPKFYAAAVHEWDAAIAEFDRQCYGQPMPHYLPTVGEAGRVLREQTEAVKAATPKERKPTKRKAKGKAK